MRHGNTYGVDGAEVDEQGVLSSSEGYPGTSARMDTEPEQFALCRSCSLLLEDSELDGGTPGVEPPMECPECGGCVEGPYPTRQGGL